VQLNNLISEVIVRDSASAVLDRVSAAMDRAADAEGRVQGGADAVTTKITGSTRALETAARQFENLKRAADPVYDRMTQLANQQLQLQRAVSLGTATQSEAADGLSAAGGASQRSLAGAWKRDCQRRPAQASRPKFGLSTQ
jgi:hypothetical protein